MLGKADKSKALMVDGSEGQFKLIWKTPNPTIANVETAHKAMWQLREIKAPAGAVAPKYVFVNMYTGTPLALNTANAVTDGSDIDVDATLGGDVTEWLNALSYKAPEEMPLWSSLANLLSARRHLQRR